MRQIDQNLPTLSDAVVARLRDLIVSREIEPGARLTETSVARLMSVSRTPAATALRTLTKLGLVKYEQNRGYWVREIRVEDVLAGYEIRATLEGLACRLAAEYGVSAEVRDILVECVETGRALTDAEQLNPADHAPYQDMNATFHAAILEASGNPKLPDFVASCHEMPFTSNRIVYWGSRDVVRRSQFDHERIVEAILARQGTRAEMLMREHVLEAGAIVGQKWPEIIQASRQPALAASGA